MINVISWGNKVFNNRREMIEEFRERYGDDWIEVLGVSNGKGKVKEKYRKMMSKRVIEVKLNIELIDMSYREYRNSVYVKQNRGKK